MREGAPAEVLAGASGWRPVVSSWLGGAVVAESIPVAGGRATGDTKQQVPERLSFQVPRFDGRDWLPGDDPTHPLARFGQELDVQIVVTSAVTGVEYETRIGRYLVQDWDYDDLSGLIRVEAVGLLQVAADDRLTSPLAPRANGSLASEFRRLLPSGMSVGIDPALTDRPCPQSMEWADDRIGALYEIADAWPARLRTDQWGQLNLLPPLPAVPAPVLTYRDGEGGTVVEVARTDTRDQAYNVVVARATQTDDPKRAPVQAVAEQRTGPMGTDTYHRVVRVFSSPLISSGPQAASAAAAMLRDSLRPSRMLPVTIVPDPRVDLDDPVEILRDGMRDWGYVAAYDLPLTMDDGAMRIDVAVGV